MHIPRECCIFLKLVLMVMGAVPVIWSGAWMNHQSSTRCDRYLNKPFLEIGVFLLLLSLARLGCHICKSNKYVDNFVTCGLLVLFFVLLGYTIFALVVTITPTNHGQSVGGIDDYKFNYSKGLRNRVLDNNHWRHIKICLVFKTHVCSSFLDVYQNDTYPLSSQSSHLSIQDGCCKPPKDCNFTYTSRGVWTKPTNATFSKPDCDEWSNDPYILGFNCQSCKEGFLHDIKQTWKKAGIVNIGVIAFLFMLWWCWDCGPDPED